MNSLIIFLVSVVLSGQVPGHRENKNMHREPRPTWAEYLTHSRERGHLRPFLPPAHRVYRHQGGHYFFWDGLWFTLRGRSYVCVIPPVGIWVPELPPNLVVAVGRDGTRYFLCESIYYTRMAGGFCVVLAPLVVNE